MSATQDTDAPAATADGGPPKATIKSSDMDPAMQQVAVDVAVEALDKYQVEKDVAQFIKKDFDKRYGQTWHCVVGKNFGSFVTHETKHFFYGYVGCVPPLADRHPLDLVCQTGRRCESFPSNPMAYLDHPASSFSSLAKLWTPSSHPYS